MRTWFVVYRWNNEGFPTALSETTTMEMAQYMVDVHRDTYPDECFYWVPERS